VKRILTSLILALCFASPALAQDATDATKQELKKVAENGKRLHVEVNGNVSAEAVLIPQVDAKRIFGKEIANNYAVVEVNIGNKSPDAALIIHNIYIDYSRWALSGATDSGVTTVEGIERDTLAPYHASNNPNRVASVESRMVRGQLLDAQPSTRRNRVIKWLSLAGTLAAAYTFSLNEEGIIRGIAAYNGVAIPGLAATFPDQVIPQLNRVSDFGFRTNTVIPKEGGEIVVCFFPIDRFLTPGFRTLFLRSPALFFAPLQMLVDNASRDDMKAALGEDLGLTPADIGAQPREVQNVLRKSLPCYLRIVRGESFNSAPVNNTLRDQMNQQMDEVCLGSFGLKKERDRAGKLTGKLVRMSEAASVAGGASVNALLGRFLALDYLSQASLNNVRVTVDGVMTVDTMSINAKLDGVTFDDVEGCGGADKSCFWSVPEGGSAVRTGTISGAYLTSGNVTIAEAAGLHIEDVKSVTEGSSDQELHFTMTLKQDVPSGKNLTFKVTKPRSGAPGTVDSQPWTYVVGFLNNESATLFGKVKYNPEARTLTLPVLDPKLSDTRFEQLTFSLTTPASGTVEESKLSPTRGDRNVVLTIPEADVTQGCWSVKVMSGTDPIGIVNKDFEVPPPPPTLTEATIEANEIVVKGTNLIDNRACSDKGLAFQLVKKGDEGDLKDGKTIRLAVDDEQPKPADSRHLKLPPEAKPGTKWTVQVRRGSDTVGEHATQEIEIK
jgi:hypothetical protein